MVNLQSAYLLLLSSCRFYFKHPAQLLLSILGIMLGIAIVTAVLITNTSSRNAFELSANAVTGQSTHQIIGTSSGIDQFDYVELRRNNDVPMTPIIEGYLTFEGSLFTVLGVDLLSESTFGRTSSNFNVETGLKLLTVPGSLIASEKTAARIALAMNQPIEASYSGGTASIQIIDTYQSKNPAATDGLLIGDIATVQEILGRADRIDRIDLIVPPDALNSLETSIPAHMQLSPSSTRNKTMAEMTRGFHINLTAMSLLALLVGAFLIHNTMTFSILQRRELFATLRISGVTSAGIFTSIVGEALLISFIGSVLGALVGFYLAGQLIQLTTRTINDLYFVLHVQELWFSPLQAIAIVVLGMLTSLVAASAAALEAARKSPLNARMRSGIETVSRSILPILCSLGIALILIGLFLARLPTHSIILGFVAMMLLIAGYGLGIPWVVSCCTRGMQRMTTGGNAVLQLAIGGIHRSISRTGLAIAALSIAVSATLGVDIMIGSFRNSVELWLNQTLQSDIYVSVEGQVSTVADGAMSPLLIEKIATMDAIDNIGSTRGTTAQTNLGAIGLNVLAPNHRGLDGFTFLNSDLETSNTILRDEDRQAIWSMFTNHGGLLISEPLARKHNLSAGDQLTLLTDQSGDKLFSIAGIYRDYGSSHGRITMARTSYLNFWQDNATSALGIILKPNQAADDVTSHIRNLALELNSQVLVRSNLEIRERSLTVFDQTFRVTNVLRLLTVGVAFIGVFSALLALQLEKAKEFAVVRATGATKTQIASIIVLQTAIMGVLAGLLAIPLGWIMSDLLIDVINLRSFGWTMSAILPSGALESTMGLSVSAAILASVYPAWRLGRADIAGALRDE